METFLRRVLPEGGEYVLSAIDTGHPATEIRDIPDIATLAKSIQRVSFKRKTNLYYAVGSYGHYQPQTKTGGRKDPLRKRALYLDLDPKEFGTKSNALQQLSSFCRAISFPGPSIYVDSGHGIHVYWCFDRDLDVPSWRTLASRLKERCLSAAFKADQVVTADAARILRIPGTLNYKESVQVPCRILKDTGVSYDPASLLHALSPPPSSGALAALGDITDKDALGIVLSGATYPAIPYFASEIVEKCGVFKEALETGGKDHSEPLWRHLMSVLTFAEDGDRFVHEISKNHPDYKEAATDAKFALVTKLKAAGSLKPILCTTFETYKPSICAACPFHGNIKTPLVLGKVEAAQYLSSSYRMGEFSVEKLVKRGDDTNPDLWLSVFPYRITNVDVFNHGTARSRQVSLSCLSKRHLYQLDFDADLLHIQGDGLSIALSRAGLNLHSIQLTEFKSIMTSWMRKMEDVKTNVAIDQSGLGWGKRGGKDAFAAGGKVYLPQGKEFDFYHPDAKLVSAYSPTGSPEIWKRAAQAITADPRQTAVCGLLTAFAAPLTCLAGVKGLTFSIYSAGSGTGKSAVLRTAQAVWGHPTIGMAMVDDTQMSVINRLGFLNTIPAYWDELRSGDTLISFIKMIFTMGQGREKARLTSSIKQQSMSSWDTLVTIASNERISDHVDRYIKNTDAGRLRLFEVTMPPLRNPDPSLKQVFSDLEHNFGHAGIEYAKFLVEHRQLAFETVQRLIFVLDKTLSKNSNERFWVAFTALILAAAALVTKAGILTIDITKLRQWLVSQYMAQQSGVQTSYSSTEDAAEQSLVQFVDDHREQMLVVDKMYPPEGHMRNIMTPPNQLPRGEISVLRSIDDKLLRIDFRVWKNWVVYKMKNSPTTFLNELLQRHGFYFKRQSMDAGLLNASNARRRVIEVCLDSVDFKGLFSD